MYMKPPSFVLALTIMSVVAAVGNRDAVDVFYGELNRFRADPISYWDENPELRIGCSVPLGESYAPLNVSTLLEGSALFQAATMATNQCPIVSHETCAAHCAEMGGCGFETRIRYFLGGATKYHNPLEVLIQGPKNPVKAFHMFLESRPHCDHILNCHINAMGAALVRADKNVLVADMAYFEDAA